MAWTPGIRGGTGLRSSPARPGDLRSDAGRPGKEHGGLGPLLPSALPRPLGAPAAPRRSRILRAAGRAGAADGTGPVLLGHDSRRGERSRGALAVPALLTHPQPVPVPRLPAGKLQPDRRSPEAAGPRQEAPAAQPAPGRCVGGGKDQAPGTGRQPAQPGLAAAALLPALPSRPGRFAPTLPARSLHSPAWNFPGRRGAQRRPVGSAGLQRSRSLVSLLSSHGEVFCCLQRVGDAVSLRVHPEKTQQ